MPEAVAGLVVPLVHNWYWFSTLVVVLIRVMLCRGTGHLPIPPHTRLWVESVKGHDVFNAANKISTVWI